MTELPAGLTTRPLALTDAAAVAAVMAAEEMATVGEVVIEEADIVADWQRPGFDVTGATIGVFDGASLVAYAEHSRHDRVDAAVHPGWHGRGIGTWLALWLVALAGRRDLPVIGMPNPEGSPGDRLLARLGWQVRWHSWVLEVPSGREIRERPLPPGYAVTQARPDQWPLVHDVIEDAFLEWSQRPREGYPDFVAGVLERPGFEEWHVRVVEDPSGTVVGAAVVVMAPLNGGVDGYVDSLAVRRDQRGRGLAQVLLVDAFARAREHGATRATLSTDSRTGALDLYLKVGMEVTQDWVNRAITL